MSIKIVLPEGNPPKATVGTKVYTSTGEEITDVTRIQMDWRANEFLSATITVNVDSIENFENLLLHLKPEILDEDNDK
jgi:hypothetical protein